MYDAFLSYSNAADTLLSERVHTGLQRFAKPWWRRNGLRVFRDVTNMGANPALWSTIAAALDDSHFLVLLASPEAAASPWVNREIEHWLSSHPASSLLIVLTSGDLVWDAQARDFDWDRSTAVPEALSQCFDEEPRHVDMRWARTGVQLDLRDGRFRNNIADLAAPIHGVSKDEIAGADVRQHRRTLRTAWAAGVALAALTVGSIVTTLFAVDAAANARASERRARVEEQRANEQAEVAADERSKAERQQALAEQSASEAERERQAAAESARLAEASQAEALASADEAEAQRVVAEAERGMAERRRLEALDSAAEAERQRTSAQRSQGIAEENEAEAQRQQQLAEANAADARANLEEASRQQALAEERGVEVQHQAEDLRIVNNELANRAAELEQRNRELQAQQQATEEQRLAALSRELAAIARDELEAGRVDLGQLLALQASRFAQRAGDAAPQQAVRAPLIHARNFSPSLSRVLHGARGDVVEIAVDPAGRYIAAGDRSGSATVWRVDTWETVAAIPGFSDGLAFMADSTLVLRGDMLRAFLPSQDSSWSEVWTAPAAIRDIVALATGGLAGTVSTGFESSTVAILDPHGTPLRELIVHGIVDSGTLSAAPTLNRVALVTRVGDNSFVEVYDTDTGTLLRSDDYSGSLVTGLAFSRDSQKLAVVSQRRFSVEAYEVAIDGERHPELIGNGDLFGEGKWGCEVSPDFYWVAGAGFIGSADGIWQTLRVQGGSPRGTSSCDSLFEFTRDGSWLLVGGTDAISVVRMPITAAGLGATTMSDYGAESVVLSPDSEVAIAIGVGGIGEIAEEAPLILATRTGQPRSTQFDWPTSSAYTKVGFGSESDVLAIATSIPNSSDASVELWSVESGRLIARLPAEARDQECRALLSFVGSLERGRLARACDHSIYIWDLRGGTAVGPTRVEMGETIRGAAFNASGTRLVVLSGSELATFSSTPTTLSYFDKSGAEWIRTRVGQIVDLIDRDTFAVSPDGETLSVGQQHFSGVTTLEVTTGRQLRREVVTSETGLVVRYAPDATLYAAGSPVSWDLDRPALDLQVRPRRAGSYGFEIPPPEWVADVLDVVAAENGDFVVVGRNTSATGPRLRFLRFTISVEDLSTSACQIAGRSLSEAEWNHYIGRKEPYEPACETPP